MANESAVGVQGGDAAQLPGGGAAVAAGGGAGSSTGYDMQPHEFHSPECEQVWGAIAAQAEAGRQPLQQEPKRGWGWWQPAQQQEEQTLRLLDFGGVRQQYKQLRSRGVFDIWLADRRKRQELEQQAQQAEQAGGGSDAAAPGASRVEAGASGVVAGANAAAAAASGEQPASSSGSGSTQQQPPLPGFVAEASQKAAAAAAHAPQTRMQPAMDATLDVSELLAADGPWQEPLKELLEDSFGLELRAGYVRGLGRGGCDVGAAMWGQRAVVALTSWLGCL